MKRYFLEKKMIYTELKAFTIVEVMVTLILTVLVFSISFLSYRIIQNQLNKYVSSSDQQTEYLSFMKAINGDVEKCLYAVATLEGFECRSERKVVNYIVQDSIIIRTNEHAVQDSFVFKGLKVTRLFQDKELLDSGKLIDEVRMSFLIEDIKHYVNKEKYYDAFTLISFKTLRDGRN